MKSERRNLWLDDPRGAVAAASREAGKPALMTVYASADAWDTSNVRFEHGRIRLYSKREKADGMRYIDYGLMICSRQIFDDSPNESRLIWQTRSRIFSRTEDLLDTK